MGNASQLSSSRLVRRSNPRRQNRRRLGLDTLEDRTLLAAIIWTNRGFENDRFEEVFGIFAETARGVVDAALMSWGRVLADLNSGTNQLNVEISMRAADDEDNVGFGGQAAPGWIEVKDGKPVSGRILIGRGNDTNPEPDGVGDGAGWFLDPTPWEHSEFTDIDTAFHAYAEEGSPADGLADLYSLVVVEMNHVVGLSPADGLRWRGLFDQLPDADGNQLIQTGLQDSTNDEGIGFLWIFQGQSISQLMTSRDGDAVAQLDPNDPSTEVPVHSARSGVQIQGVTGANDSGNAVGSGGRHLVPNSMAMLLADVYDYDIVMPETFGTFYNLYDPVDGHVLVQGGSDDSDDVIEVTRDGDELVVAVDIGNDVLGTGPTDAFELRVPDFESLASVIVNGREGDDILRLHIEDGDPIPGGPIGFRYFGDDGDDRIEATADSDLMLSGTGLSVASLDRSIIFEDSIEQADLAIDDAGRTIDAQSYSGEARLTGGNGNDTLIVGQGLSQLIGGTGNDHLEMGTAENIVSGGPDVDSLYVTGTPLGERIVLDLTQPGDIESLFVFADAGDDLVQIFSLNQMTIDIDAGTENDVVDLSFTSGPSTIFGGDGDDMLIAGIGDSVVGGFFGRDTLVASDGDDRLSGGEDDDSISSGGGSDTIEGGPGNDSIEAGTGADDVMGDDLTGGSGNDSIRGGFGSDLMIGGPGDDQYQFEPISETNEGPEVDTVLEDASGGIDWLDFFELPTDDPVIVTLGNDNPLATHSLRTVRTFVTGQAIHVENVRAGSGDDTISGNAAVNEMKGGPGNDRFIEAFDNADDQVDGEEGIDRWEFTGTLAGEIITVDAANNQILCFRSTPATLQVVDSLLRVEEIFLDAAAGKDRVNLSPLDSADFDATGLKRIEVLGGLGNDTISGSYGPDVLRGGSGDDLLHGNEGHDILLGQAGTDKLYGDAGRDLIIGGIGKDAISGGADDDLLIGGTTQHDSDLDALDAIVAEWTTQGVLATYNQRISNLTLGGGLNGVVVLTPLTVFGDAIKDRLKGETERDWFWGLGDKTDAAFLEFVN